MNTRIPLYEGDGHFHRPTPGLLQDGATARATRRTTLTPETLVSIELQARRMRSAMIQSMLTRFYDWLGQRSREVLRGRAEAYLDRSTDVADLERRMRLIERPERMRIFG